MTAAPRRLIGFAALLAACVVLLSASTEAIAGSSRICRQLEAELSSGSGGGRSSAQLRKQDGAITRQREQLQLARKQSRSAGCGFSLFGGGAPKCSAVNTKIERMERNLEALQRKRMKLAGDRAGRPRSTIIAALNANGCRDRDVAERRLPGGIDDNRTLLDKIFGGGIKQRGAIDDDLGGRRDEDSGVRRILKPRDGGWVNENGIIRYSAPSGRYRTLCVRTCDGYFFPMSNASSPMDFDRDQQNCETSCPGTDVQIYYHRATSEESADMVSSASGEPYSDLPTAYLYKQAGTQRPASCGCNQPRNFEILAGNPPSTTAVQSEPVIPMPARRPDPATDPETLANSDGGLDAEMLRRIATAPKTKPAGPEGVDKKVRVVGPMFLPDPGAAIDLQDPAPNQVR